MLNTIKSPSLPVAHSGVVAKESSSAGAKITQHGESHMSSSLVYDEQIKTDETPSFIKVDLEKALSKDRKIVNTGEAGARYCLTSHLVRSLPEEGRVMEIGESEAASLRNEPSTSPKAFDSLSLSPVKKVAQNTQI